MNNNHTTVAVEVTLTRNMGLFDVTMIGVGPMIGATGEGLFEQRLLGSIPERVAREAATTVTMTKRTWRLKSMVGQLGGGPG